MTHSLLTIQGNKKTFRKMHQLIQYRKIMADYIFWGVYIRIILIGN